MNSSSLSKKTLAELYKYLQHLKKEGESYNDLRTHFQLSGIEPLENVIHNSTRNIDRFLNEYLLPLNLENYDDVRKIIRLVEQTVELNSDLDSLNLSAQELILSMHSDGWHIVGRKFVQVGHSVDDILQSMLKNHPAETIQTEWDRAKQSISTDPADAITAANALIEATYKFILYHSKIPLPKSQKLSTLSKIVHSRLQLSPEQAADEDFRAIFQSVITISQSVGSLRTKIGDAHGSSPRRGQPLSRHAQLAVNAAGTVCTFLISVYLAESRND